MDIITPHVDLLYEHPSGIKVLSKPAPMDTLGFDDSGVPRLYSMMKEKFKDEIPDGEHIHLKRIDRFTSGLQLIGTTKVASAFLSKEWHQSVHKSYLAIIERPRWTQVDISMPIHNKHSRTGLTILQTNEDGYAIVKAELLEFGRTHQIRRVLKFLGSEIVGDFFYRGTRLPLNARQGQMLHAWRIQFPVPALEDDEDQETRYEVVQSPVPDDYRLLFDFDWEDIDKNATMPIRSWEVDETAYTHKVEVQETEDILLGEASGKREQNPDSHLADSH